MACLFGHKMADGKCVRCGGAMIHGVLTPEETEQVIGVLDTYKLLYERFALEGGGNGEFGTNMAQMFAVLKTFFEASDKTHNRTEWETVQKCLVGIQNALPEVLSQTLIPKTAKIEQYLKSFPR